MTPFLDTSVLVKRYVDEPGSITVRRLLRRMTPAVARITYAELAAVIARAAREKVIDERHRDGILARLDEDFASFTVVEIRRAMLGVVPVLVVQHALRGYDAVQLAAALAIRHEGGAVAFWSTDDDLITAARAEGLQGVLPA